MSTTTLIIIIAVIVVIALIALFFLFRGRGGGEQEEQREHERERERESRRERAREEFGPEYERAARERGSEDEAAEELHERRERVRSETEPLSDESRQRYEGRWEEVEQVFVDNPARSIEMADRTVSDLLEERRFIADAAQDDAETEKRLAVAYPDVADDYREARRMRASVVSRTSGVRDTGSDRSDGGSESPEDGDSGTASETNSGSSREDEDTESLRQALRKYRAVYKKLVDG